MDATTLSIIVLIVIAVVIVVLIGALWAVSRRSARLQRRFGPEYSRAVDESGGQRAGEATLREREKRHERLELRSLPDEARSRYRDEWNGLQQRFVDVPGQAVREADHLVSRIMREVGYPVDDFEQRSADLSVEHPGVVDKYRAAHGVAVEHERGKADTEELRGAVTSYRALVEELLGDRATNGHGGQDQSRQSRQ